MLVTPCVRASMHVHACTCPISSQLQQRTRRGLLLLAMPWRSAALPPEHVDAHAALDACVLHEDHGVAVKRAHRQPQLVGLEQKGALVLVTAARGGGVKGCARACERRRAAGVASASECRLRWRRRCCPLRASFTSSL